MSGDPGVACIVCGLAAVWTTVSPDDANAAYPTYACDEQLTAVLRRQYTGDVLVCLIWPQDDAPDDAPQGQKRALHTAQHKEPAP